MPRRKRSKPLGIFILPLIVLALFLLLSFASLVIKLPEQAEQRFGSPANWLTIRQRYWYSILLLWQEKDLTIANQPVNEEIKFTVLEGESVASITGRLWEAGLINNPGAFRTYLLYTGLDTSIKAGKYTFTSELTPIQLAQAMQSAVSSEIIFTLLPGWRVEEVAEALPSSGLNITSKDFLQAVNNPPQGYSFSQRVATTTLEGFLFPGTYELARESNVEELIRTLLDSFEANISQEMRAMYDKQGLNLYRAVTLASIISREAVVVEEMPMIASVFYNRLSAGMLLESDPTVQYALGYNQAQGTWWTNPLSLADLQVDSPYNTYRYPGLPPGPIANPGLQALKAVAAPAQTPYYYFRAACDQSGRHIFAETYEEHLGNACP